MTATTSIAGVVFRRLRAPEDYAGMAVANQRARESAGRPSAITAADMAQFIGHLVNCDPERDIVIVELEGRIVGYSIVLWRDLTDGDRIFVNWSILEPAVRGPGVGAALRTWADGRMVAGATGLSGHAPTHAVTFTWGDEAQGAALLASSGWTEHARGYEMLRPTLDAIPEIPLPDGLELRSLDASDAGRLWDALVDGFRDHRNMPEKSADDRERFLEDRRQDASLWIVAFDGDEIAGGVIDLIDPDEPERDGRRLGYIEAVFTRPPWRRRGLARALVARGLERLRERGMTSAALSVDGANPNQAMTLYEDLGFVIASVETEWRKSVQSIQASEVVP